INRILSAFKFHQRPHPGVDLSGRKRSSLSRSWSIFVYLPVFFALKKHSFIHHTVFPLKVSRNTHLSG
ncbi:hypothetical protein OFB62_30505, partial [Escherichia coli]|nr:hypothetical protein [Escherichia coli]